MSIILEIINTIINSLMNLTELKPDKKDKLARSLRELNESLSKCHSTYSEYCICYKKTLDDSLPLEIWFKEESKLEKLYLNWLYAIEEFSDKYLELHDIIEVFDIDSHYYLHAYYKQEHEIAENIKNHPLYKMKLIRRGIRGDLVKYLRHSQLQLLHDPTYYMNSVFKKAQSALAKFIRDNTNLVDFF